MKKKNNFAPISLDISVLTAGRSDLFEKCLDEILTQYQPEYKIHVCNNGHPSAEYERIYEKLPQNSSIKRNNVDGGFSVGANAAMNSGRSPLVLFITDDVFIHPGAIETLINVMKDPSIGQCGYKFLFPEESGDIHRPAGRVQHIGMASTINGDMTHPLIGWSSTNSKCNISRDVLAVTGASFIIRRNVFNKVGGFDPVYGKGYYEDMDLSFKVRQSGSRVYVTTDAVATHGVGQTFKNETTPPPVQQNQMTFRTRWLYGMPWSEFEIW